MLTVKRILLVALLVFWSGVFSAAAQDELTQTYTSEDETLTFDLPEEWFATEFVAGGGLIYFANSEENLGFPSEGGLSGTVAQPQLFNLILSAHAADADEETAATVEAYVAATLGGNAPEEIEVDELEVGEQAAWQVLVPTETLDYLFLFIQITEDDMLALQAESVSGEMSDFEPTLLAIAETVQYEPAEASEAPAYALGLWGTEVSEDETFKVMLANIANERLDYIGIICAPNGRVDVQGIFIVGSDLAVSDEGEFSLEADQFIIEGQYDSATSASGTIETLEDLSFCGIPEEATWQSSCDLNLVSFGSPGMFSTTVSADGRLMRLEFDGLSFEDTESGSCDVAETDDE